MPHTRKAEKGSFGSHFDELVAQFAAGETRASLGSTERPRELQDKVDIHAALFEHAWKLDADG